jgi:AhpD family alkylhydroperoxidase
MSKSKACCSPSNSTLVTPAVAELIALGAAVAANCEPCFKHHYSAARKLGVCDDDMAQAVKLADMVKRAPAANMLALADKLLGTSLATQTPAAPAPGCCSSDAKPSPRKGKGA